jgi:predicted dehydrogenase
MYMDYSGGPVTDLYPHLLAPIVYALGLGFPKRVVAIGGQYIYHGEREVPDTFDMLAEYPEGLTVSVLGCQGNGSNIDPMIRGTEGMITLRESNFNMTVEPPTEKKDLDLLNFNYVYEHVKNFLHCLSTRTKPDADIEVGYRTMLPLIMAMQSHLMGKVARFDQDSEQIKFE